MIEFLDQLKVSTRKNYRTKLQKFLQFIDVDYTEFLRLTQPEALKLVIRYCNHLKSQQKSPATINNYLAAIKSWVDYEGLVDNCDFSLRAIKGEKVKTYRDTSGVGIEKFGNILHECDRSTLLGKRDYAILRLLLENVLRRSEVCSILQSDFCPQEHKLWILGKGKEQKEAIAISDKVVDAINDYLNGVIRDQDAPLFITLGKNSQGNPLKPDRIYDLVVKYCDRAKIGKKMSPHRLRHSGITAFLELSDGDIRGGAAIGAS